MTMVPDNDPESILDRVVQDFLEAQLQGRRPDIEEIVRAHPELEQQIRQRIQSLQEVDDLFAGLVQDAGNPATAAFGHDLIGRRLGDFEILRLIGKGSMGAVFLARQVSLGREVALKVIADVGGSQSKSLERFRREATVLAQLSHPHIVPIHDIGQEGPYAYFAMEYVRGVSLDVILAAVRRAGPAQKASDILRRRLTQPVADDASGHQGQPHATAGAQIDRDYIVAISNIVVEVASALQCAHDRGILHRDVKPSNILIDSDGRAKLVDFGLARAQSHPSITAAGDFFGTPNYVSPEQIRSPESADGRADVYSLAATYYECLTLRRPCEGDTVNETLTNVLSREIIPPRRHSPRLVPDLNTVLLHALEKQPQDRYQSPADFAADIQNVLEFKPITAKRPATVTRVCRVAGRNLRVVAFVVVAAPLCIAAYVAVSKGLAYRAQREAQKLYEIGVAKKGAQSYAEAIRWFDQACAKAPGYIDAYLGSVECYRVLREYDCAEQLCRKAISIDASSPIAHLSLGLTLADQNKWEQAALAFERAAALQPDYAQAHHALALCYSLLKIDGKALAEYRRVLSIEPNFPNSDDIARFIGNAAAGMRQYSAAIDAYHQALHINPNLVDAYIGLGIVYRASAHSG